MKFVIDFEGFQLKNRFILKELAVADLNSMQIVHFFIRSPFGSINLSSSDLSVVRYCETFIHKIRWNAGKVAFKDTVEYLNSLPNESVFYAKGKQKVNFLKSILSSSMEVQDLELVECPPITRIINPPENDCPLPFHQDSLNCAHIKASAYLKLLRAEKENLTNQKSEIQEDDGRKILFDLEIPDDSKLAMYMKLVNEFNQKISEITNKPVPVNVTGVIYKPTVEKPQTKEKTFIDNESFDTAENLVHLNTQDRTLISMFPPSFQQRAEIVIKFLKERPDLICWDKQGVVTFFGDELCESSSLFDLLNFLIRELKWKVAPNGINRFLLICKKLHVPASVLRKKLREQYLRAFDHFGVVKSASDSVKMFNDNKHRLLHWSSLEDSTSADEDIEPLTSTPNKTRRTYSS
ncbi:unnamed protein product [Orchesella dallaii]|uniref:Uncharacterized protein n=1 Tax=Orchesella dallaii TaxID=48710 RepID=A0ABP1RM11_9HEXA